MLALAVVVAGTSALAHPTLTHIYTHAAISMKTFMILTVLVLPDLSLCSVMS
jgi:hypothetical protein